MCILPNSRSIQNSPNSSFMHCLRVYKRCAQCEYFSAMGISSCFVHPDFLASWYGRYSLGSIW